MKRGKRRLWILCAVVAACLLGAGLARAEAAAWTGGVASGFEGGSGIETDPYKIATPEQLAYLAQQVKGGNTFKGKTIKLTVEIDLGAREWTPIGIYAFNPGDGMPFSGTFDGGGHVVRNLRIEEDEFSAVGLFGYVGTGSKVENVGVVEVEIAVTGAAVVGVGGLVGRSEGSVINSYATGSVSGGENVGVGGLVGINEGSVIDSYATGSVSGKGTDSVGGLVGGSKGSVSNSYATGSVSGERAHSVGGLLGENYGSVIDSYATGSVSGDAGSVGGLVGYIEYDVDKGSRGTVSNSYATGSVKGMKATDTSMVPGVGGLVGYIDGGSVSNSYATGSVSGMDANAVGGLVGGNKGGSVTACVFDKQGTGQAEGIGGGAGTAAAAPLLTSAMTGDSKPSGLGGDVWECALGYYPQLKVFADSENPFVKAASAFSVVPVFLDAATPDTSAGVTKVFSVPKMTAGVGELVDIQWSSKNQGILFSSGTGRWSVGWNNTVTADTGITLTATDGHGNVSEFALKIMQDGPVPGEVTGSTTTPALPTLDSLKVTAGGASILSVETPDPIRKYYALSVANSVGSATVSASGADGAAVVIKPPSSVTLTAGATTYVTVTATKNVGGTAYMSTYTLAIARAAGTPQPGDPDGGPQPSPSAKSPDVTSVSVVIGGTTYQGTVEGDRIVLDLPAGTDVSKLNILIAGYPGATVSPKPPYDFSKGSVTITVTSPDGSTKKEYTITVNVATPQPVTATIVNALASNCTARLTQNADGTWGVEILIPFDAGFDAAQIETIAATLVGLANVRFYYVDENGVESEIAARKAGQRYLKIAGTAADRPALADVALTGVSVWKQGDATEYKQSLNLKLTDVPGGAPAPESGGGSSGCNAGALGLFGLALLPALRLRSGHDGCKGR